MYDGRRPAPNAGKRGSGRRLRALGDHTGGQERHDRRSARAAARACPAPLGDVIRGGRTLVNMPIDGSVADDFAVADDQPGLRTACLPDGRVVIRAFASPLLIVT
jgi:hypothetical protein